VANASLATLRFALDTGSSRQASTITMRWEAGRFSISCISRFTESELSLSAAELVTFASCVNRKRCPSTSTPWPAKKNNTRSSGFTEPLMSFSFCSTFSAVGLLAASVVSVKTCDGGKSAYFTRAFPIAFASATAPPSGAMSLLWYLSTPTTSAQRPLPSTLFVLDSTRSMRRESGTAAGAGGAPAKRTRRTPTTATGLRNALRI
jgi:hypothetical protein